VLAEDGYEIIAETSSSSSLSIEEDNWLPINLFVSQRQVRYTILNTNLHLRSICSSAIWRCIARCFVPDAWKQHSAFILKCLNVREEWALEDEITTFSRNGTKPNTQWHSATSQKNGSLIHTPTET